MLFINGGLMAEYASNVLYMVLSTIKCHLALAVLLFVGGHVSSRLVFLSS